MNKVLLFGRVGKAPEMRYTPGGTAVTNLSLATDEGKVKDSDERRTEWHRLVAWGKTAEIIAEHVVQGQQVAVEGRLQTRQWEGNDGQKRYSTEIVIDRFDFGAKPNGNGRRQEQQQQPVAAGGYDDAPRDVDPDEIPF